MIFDYLQLKFEWFVQFLQKVSRWANEPDLLICSLSVKTERIIQISVVRGQKSREKNFWFIGGLFKALSLTVYLQIDFEDFELNFLKKGYKSDLTNLGFSLPEVSGVTWYRWRQGALTFDPTAKLTGCEILL